MQNLHQRLLQQLPSHTVYQQAARNINVYPLQTVKGVIAYNYPRPPLVVIQGSAPYNNPYLTVHRKISRTKVINVLSAVTEHIDKPLNTWKYTGKSKWQLGPYKSNVINVTRSLLRIISGGNVVGLLSSVLSEREQLSLSVVSPMVDAVKTFVNDNSNGSERQKAMQFLSPFVTFDALKSFGFNTSTRGVYGHSKKKYLDQNTLQFHCNGTKGRPSIINDPQIQSLVINHCNDNADYMHEDILKRKTKKYGKGRKVFHAKRLRYDLNRIYKMFPHKTRIKRSSFFKLVKKHGEFKKSRKWTDLCEFCEDAKQSKKVINNLIRKCNEYQNDTENEVQKITDLHVITESMLDIIKSEVIECGILNDHDLKVFENKINDLILWIEHRDEFKKSKDEYRKAVKHSNSRRCVFTADFKQKIPIGHKLREPSHIFRNIQLRNCLGVHLQFAHEKYVFHVITNVTNQTSLLSKCILSYILDHPAVINKFKNDNIEIADFWYDHGTHFYNNSLLHFHFFDLAQRSNYRNLNEIGVHFFPGKHGKNDCDSTFTYVSHAVKKQDETEHGTQCSQDIVDALHKAESNRQKEAKQPTTYFAVNFDIDGPLGDSEYMKPLKMDIPMEREMVTPQLLSFKHYFYRRDEQQQDLMTEREIQDGDDAVTLRLPSMRNAMLKQIDRVFIKTKYRYSSKALFRRHRWKLKKATPIKIGGDVKHPEMSRDEMHRQRKRRAELEEKHGEDDSNILCVDIDGNDDVDDAMNEADDEETHLLPYTEQSVRGMNKTQLKVLCVEHKLSRHGTKKVLLKRLLHNLAVVKGSNSVSQ